ncbi:MAG: 2-C-methyl-D-erythritol 2,4-cyclodiphosphate synthase [Candidatus Thiodiazotropha sp.]
MRIGQGYDAHRFEAGSKLKLGGVKVPYDQSLVAHSDGDVLIHALCDALLGAAGLGDIGRHFPDNDPAYEGIDSRVLLRQVMTHLHREGWQVANADLTIVAQRPKLAPYIDAMCSCLSADMQIETQRVNIKATTTEGMGFTGRGEGIAAMAVVLLEEHRID